MTENAYLISGADRPGRWLVTCDHATNAVPDWVNGGDLGLPVAEMGRHIAFDIGAEGVALGLGAALNSPVIASRFSRLVIDPNRGELDPTLLMKLYDGTIIPGNARADDTERERRLDLLHRPYHAALEALAAQRDGAVICAIHSFTPKLKGRAPRPWEIGVLYAEDDRLAQPFIAACRAAGWTTGDNQPYRGYLPGDSIDRHALQKGRPNLLIEVRHDLIDTPDGEALWAARLAPILEKVLADSGL